MSHTDGIVSRYLQHMHLRNLSEVTIKDRRCILDRLGRYIGAPVLYATGEQLLAWQTERAALVLPTTRRSELAALRAFYTWAVSEGFIDRDPTARLPIPKEPRRVPRPMPDHRLTAAMQAGDDTMRVILGLAAFAGLRAKEIGLLDWSEVTLDGPEPLLTVVNGKGGKGRVVPLSPLLVGLLAALPDRHGPVVRRRLGRVGHNSANLISKRAADHLRACGISERLHAGRHRFATTAYRGTRDLRAVQDLLGHASPTTTAVYAAPSSGAAYSAVLAAGQVAA
jgi:integrase/recombinase XerC